MSAPRTLRCLLALGALATPSISRAEDFSRPNVVLISLDTLRADHLSAWGHVEPTSPTLDRLAREGVLFAAAWSTCSWTLPSHASLLSGRYPTSHGAVTRRDRLSPKQPNLAVALREIGYDTAAFVSATFVDREYGFARGFRVQERHGREFAGDERPESPLEQWAGPATVARARHWLEEEWTGDPFFLFVHAYDPHEKYLRHPGVTGRFSAERYAERPPAPSRRPTKPRTMTQDERREMLRRYDGEIRTLDAEIGELLRALDDLDLTDYTLVFVASDHGEEFLDHGSWGHANVLYDELLHVPLIVRYPGSFEGGRVVDAPVSLVDVYSTVAAITGLSTRRVQGVPLHDTMAECSSRTGLAASTLRLRAYRDRTWKIIVPRDRGEPELFRYTTDPGERHDLAREYPEKLRELLRSAEELRTDRFFSETASDPAAHALSPETRRELETLGYAD